jgi:putative tRNA adenosine deaminase-associated protein
VPASGSGAPDDRCGVPQRRAPAIGAVRLRGQIVRGRRPICHHAGKNNKQDLAGQPPCGCRFDHTSCGGDGRPAKVAAAVAETVRRGPFLRASGSVLRSVLDTSDTGHPSQDTLSGQGERMEQGGTDFAVVAYREDGAWQVAPLPARVTSGLELLLAALRAQPSEGETIGLASIDDDYFVAIRLTGDHVKALLSDVTASEESTLAREVLDGLDLGVQDPDDFDEVQPAGDLGIFADLGMDAMEIGTLVDDLDLYPDEMLASISSRLGFGDLFQRAVDPGAG